MQGKLVSFTAKLNNGVHETYDGQKGTLYKFNITLDCNGTQIVGTANSTKQQPSWKVGEEYTFEKKETVTTTGTYVNIKGLKALNSSFNPNSGKQSNPTFVIQKALECAITSSTLFFELNPTIVSLDNINALRDKMYNYIVKDKEEKQRWIRISSLKAALEYHRAIPNPQLEEGVTLSKWILDIAENIYSVINEVITKQLEIDK
jgi:hypothetical protein